ncbi:MAG TPA: cytochrome P450 [Actinospica sp.]|jgi:cytochrome P450|nr:cytochrome P450 [Actinospica sp.]
MNDVPPTPVPSTATPSHIPPLPQVRTLLDPPPEFTARRGRRPISRVALWGETTAWLITRHDEAKAVLADARFSANVSKPGFPGMTPSAPPRSPGHIQFMDPPEHGRLRRMVLPDFTFRRIEQLRPAIRQTCERLIDELTAAGPGTADLVETFALPLPTLVICELLGVPYERRAFFQEHSQAFFNTSSTREQMFAARLAIQGYLSELLAAKSAEPADDLLSRLAVDRVATGEAGAEEAVGLASLLLVAGHETTAHMFPLGVVALLRHPEQLDKLRADPDGWPEAIEELLRYLTIAHTGMRRIATHDVEVGGVLIRAGEGVVVALDAANRDPEVFADPDTLDLSRNARAHLAFGYGLHQCVGQSLARAELQIGLPLLFERLPELRLATDDPEQYMLRGRAVHGVSRLPVAW